MHHLRHQTKTIPYIAKPTNIKCYLGRFRTGECEYITGEVFKINKIVGIGFRI